MFGEMKENSVYCKSTWYYAGATSTSHGIIQSRPHGIGSNKSVFGKLSFYLRIFI
jgi:hypothetical protein